MSQLLQNIATTISVGQFIDWADGKTLLTDNDAFDPSLISAVLYKNGVGQALTLAKSGSNAINLFGNNDGMASLVLTGLNVNTSGTLQISFSNAIIDGISSDYILPFSVSYDVNPYGHSIQHETIALDVSGADDFYPRITAIGANDGEISLTVEGDGAITVYGRQAGSYAWQVVGSAANDSSPVVIADLTAATMYEFYVTDESATPQPSNIVAFYLHDPSMPTVVEVEKWAAGRLAMLGVFKTADQWKHQLSATEGGLSNLDKYAPCAFVGEQPVQDVDREGGMALNHKVVLVVLLAQQSVKEGGAARLGNATTIGTAELRVLVIAALEKQCPGGNLGVGDFYYKGAQEIIDIPKQHGVKMLFEAERFV
ncbi:MAG: hypothetical protein LLF76_02255 [Planctomycetaceae bacterium]|nr:hypothetical protein [Planctomycetaceae bacterium]